MGEFFVTRGSNDTDTSSSNCKPKRFCYCGELALLLTSKTQGNPERRFFRCKKYKSETCCGYFEWAEEAMNDRDKELILEQKAMIKTLKATVETLKCLLLISWFILFVVWYKH